MGRRLKLAGFAAMILSLALTATGLGPALGSVRDPLGPCGTWQVSTDSLFLSGSDSGPGLAALAQDDVWVGDQWFPPTGSFASFIEHWDGSKWTHVRTPPPKGVADSIEAMTAVGHDDVWATGYTFPKSGGSLPLAEHWNGTTWTMVPTPRILSPGGLVSVSAASTGDVWAVGTRQGDPNHWATLTMHWDGSRWSRIPSPNGSGRQNYLFAVSAAPNGEAWAVGLYGKPNGSRPLILHWDGVSWELAAAGDPGTGSLSSVTAISPTDVWAVGNALRGGFPVPLIEHWDGTTWQRVEVPAGPFSSALTRVSAASSDDVWAVGYLQGGRSQGLTEHWDGHAWRAVTNAFSLYGELAALPDGVWAYGNRDPQHLCAAAVSDSGFSPDAHTVHIGEGVTWRIDPAATLPHRIRDGSGMGLFDSTGLAPGSWYGFDFPAAGTYRVVDTGTHATATVSEPISVGQFPNKRGAYPITWAQTAPPAGFVFDVQVERPGAPQFHPWQDGVIILTARFRPDVGPGTYTFRARLRNTSNGATSDWSPAGSFTST